MRVALCDDTNSDLENLKKLLQAYSKLNNIPMVWAASPSAVNVTSTVSLLIIPPIVVIGSFSSHLKFVNSFSYGYQSITSTPMERAVPAIMLIAASRLAAFKSGIFNSAIF